MWSSEYFGRKRSIQIGSAISVIAAAVMTASVDIPMFIVARFFMVSSPNLANNMRSLTTEQGFGIGMLQF
jgi:MFS family permease